MTKALSSAVDLTLAGEQYELVPSLKAATTVSRAFGGFLGAYQALSNGDLEAYNTVIRAGIGRNSISTDDLREAIYRTGLKKLSTPVSRFVGLLQNGGRDPDDEDDAGAEDEAGNGEV